MKSFVKNLITVLICIICSFACLIFFAIYLVHVDELNYSPHKLTDPKIVETEAVSLGKDYENFSYEGMTTYLLKIKVENTSAIGIDASHIHMVYDVNTYGNYSYMITGEAAFEYGSWDKNYYIRPGETCTLLRLIAIDDGCEKMDLILRDFKYNDKQKVTVNL